ncbi:hypothetical protein J5N97_016135 [Dioscorea zingiberensis]|uniref:Protein ENHANCED DISEASE RESISTANCE 2 C-terminal domain-containing protein n=1 Tax=Dioscorea zingiberensis TaxID=325984 RepID=A0A9D5CLA2_9LILI|nr:hypothetical protein J5N97_016135 [Dioscorea zingiberensis]
MVARRRRDFVDRLLGFGGVCEIESEVDHGVLRLEAGGCVRARRGSGDGTREGEEDGDQAEGLVSKGHGDDRRDPRSGARRSAGADVFESHLSSQSVDEGDGVGGDGILDNCGLLPNNCLPCLAPTALTVEKRRSPSSSPPHSRKKTPLKLSFKWKSGGAPTLFSTKGFIERPLAGSQVPFCPAEKKMLNCWSRIEPCTFRVRGENYFRDKKKDFAPNYAAYYPFGVDVYLSQRKIDHIARFVELPVVDTSCKFPPILIVNVQVLV